MWSDNYNNQWHSRVFDLSFWVNKTVSMAWVDTEHYTANAGWSIDYQDYVLLGADGAVHKLFSRDQSVSADVSSTPGMSGLSYGVTHVPNLGNATGQTTTFYHGDHLGSSRMLSSADGYPTWQGTYYPYGMEYTPPTSTDNTATVNHYKFTGKERDAESGLDYFGARYMSSVIGGFLTPDPDQESGFENPDDPQSWNGYSYARNNPINVTDPTGQAFQYCQKDANSNPTNCQNVSDPQHAEDVNGGVNTFKNGNIYDGDLSIGTYKDLGPDLPGDPEANRLAATTVVQTVNGAMTEFGKNAAYAVTGAVVLRGLGFAAEATLTTLAGEDGVGLQSARAINRIIGNRQRELLGELFKTGKPPEGLSRRSLQLYKTIAQRAIAAGKDGGGEQARRLQLIDNALK